MQFAVERTKIRVTSQALPAKLAPAAIDNYIQQKFNKLTSNPSLKRQIRYLSGAPAAGFASLLTRDKHLARCDNLFNFQKIVMANYLVSNHQAQPATQEMVNKRFAGMVQQFNHLEELLATTNDDQELLRACYALVKEYGSLVQAYANGELGQSASNVSLKTQEVAIMAAITQRLERLVKLSFIRHEVWHGGVRKFKAQLKQILPSHNLREHWLHFIVDYEGEVLDAELNHQQQLNIRQRQELMSLTKQCGQAADSLVYCMQRDYSFSKLGLEQQEFTEVKLSPGAVPEYRQLLEKAQALIQVEQELVGANCFASAIALLAAARGQLRRDYFHFIAKFACKLPDKPNLAKLVNLELEDYYIRFLFNQIQAMGPVFCGLKIKVQHA